MLNDNVPTRFVDNLTVSQSWRHGPFLDARVTARTPLRAVTGTTTAADTADMLVVCRVMPAAAAPGSAATVLPAE